MEPLINLSKIKTWQMNLVQEVCGMAVEKNAILNDKNIFPHLNSNGSLRQSKITDRACNYLQSMYNGIFLRKSQNLFGSLDKNVLETKQAEEAVKKLKLCKGSIKKIRAFVLRCAYNYFAACTPGMDCAQPLKKHWPVRIDEFFTKIYYEKDDRVAYFLLFYFKTETLSVNKIDNIINSLSLSNKRIDMLDAYGAKNIESYGAPNEQNTERYWTNIRLLVDEYNKLKKENKTSYSIGSYFDFILAEVQKQVDYFGKVYPVTFSLTSKAVAQAMKIIKDK
jgi:hypothetical protein